MQRTVDTPDPGGRSPAPGRAGQALSAALSLLLVAPFLLLGYRAWFHAFPWQAAPDRLRWCSRDYDRSSAPSLTRAQVEAVRESLPGDAPYPTAVVGHWPAPGWFSTGRTMLAKPTPPARRDELGLPCAMDFWLQVGPDSYVAYTLVGGP